MYAYTDTHKYTPHTYMNAYICTHTITHPESIPYTPTHSVVHVVFVYDVS